MERNWIILCVVLAALLAGTFWWWTGVVGVSPGMTVMRVGFTFSIGCLGAALGCVVRILYP